VIVDCRDKGSTDSKDHQPYLKHRNKLREQRANRRKRILFANH
jgi:hypothetical protein